MAKIKCHICKAKNKEILCRRCGADLNLPHTEELALTSGGYTLFSDNAKNTERFSSCKVAFTSRRLVVYKIKPQANNPTFGLFKDLVNTIKKNPCISISLSDIEWVRRYDTKYVISTKTSEYFLWLSKSKEFDKLFDPYKKAEE